MTKCNLKALCKGKNGKREKGGYSTKSLKILCFSVFKLDLESKPVT